MRELLARLRDWLRRDQLDAELAEELRFHRAHLERDTTGGKPGLGNVTRIHEDARERWSLPWLDHLQQDVRYAVRGLKRSPGFTVAVVLTLGLGIGANAAMFNLIDQLMFRPFPYLRDPGTVHRVYLRTAGWARDNLYVVFPYTRYADLARWSTTFSATAGFVAGTHGVGSGDATRERVVLGVTGNFFEFFDARPALGRFIAPSDDVMPSGENVAVLGFGLWTSDYGSRNVLGESIQVGNTRYTIVGVAPERFIGVAEGAPPAIYVPITAYATNEGGGSRTDYFLKYNWDWVQMMVRRKPGVTEAIATADLTNAFLRSWEASRAAHPLYRSAAEARPSAVAGPLKTAAGPTAGLEARTLLWVCGVALTVLLIACANVSNLVLARALRRRREIALRLALGVSRRRLIAQAFSESLVLAALGCLTGIAFAQWGGLALHRLFIADGAGASIATDWRTLAVAMVAALGAAIVTALVPVIFAGDADITSTLKSGSREGMQQRSGARSALLVVQSALCVMLLVGAGLFVRSLGNVRDVRLGYDVDRVLMARWERRGTSLDSASRVTLRQRMLDAALARPEVERAAWINHPPFGQGTSTLLLEVPGIDSVSRLGRFTYQITSADYFATVNTRVLRGRAYTEADRAGTPPVVVVSDAMAAALWPGRDALGQCMRVSWRSRPAGMPLPCTTVIGVVENAVHDPIADYPFRYYLPEAQVDFGATSLLLRLRRDPSDAAEDIRRTLQAVMPGQSHVVVEPARDLVNMKRRSWLVGAAMFVGFGLLAVLVATVGLYAVVAYDVAQRRHELGVRIALGARGGDIARLVVGQGARLAAIGVALGIALALVVARWIQPLLFQQSATDPMVLGAVGVLLIGVAVVASSLPAARAMRADPNTVLRAE
jgi:putative ABC transport system permease protein